MTLIPFFNSFNFGINSKYYQNDIRMILLFTKKEQEKEKIYIIDSFNWFLLSNHKIIKDDGKRKKNFKQLIGESTVQQSDLN